MEIFELRYFLAVAQVENVNQAAKDVHVSPGSLSKAISRLEEELQTPLFFRVGRGIRLTPEGQRLKVKAAEIVSLEEATRYELKGKDSGSVNVTISSDEVMQSAFGIKLVETIAQVLPRAQVKLQVRDEQSAIGQVREGEAHLAFITGEPPKDLKSKTLAKVIFQTCASKKHPLVKKYGAKKAVEIEEVLEFPFVSPENMFLGQVHSSNHDGWRDDKFPRKIQYKVSGLKIMESLIQSGKALGYLPDYFIEECDLVPLNVFGCPYNCKQTVRVIAKDPNSLSWLRMIWDNI